MNLYNRTRVSGPRRRFSAHNPQVSSKFFDTLRQSNLLANAAPPAPVASAPPAPYQYPKAGQTKGQSFWDKARPVSYTHLTLPTKA